MKSAKSTSPFKPPGALSLLVLLCPLRAGNRPELSLTDSGSVCPGLLASWVSSLPPAWVMPGTGPEASHACTQFQAVHTTQSAICGGGRWGPSSMLRGLLQRIWWGGPPTLRAGRPLLMCWACHIHPLLHAKLSCLPSPSPSHPSACSHLLSRFL